MDTTTLTHINLEIPCEPPTTIQGNYKSSFICLFSHITKKDNLEQQSRKTITPIGAPDEEDPSRLTPQDLEKLVYSKEIHDFLEYPQLREIITKLDTSKQPEKDLDLIRAQDPVFDDFTKLLVDITFKDKLAAFQQKK